MSETNFTEIMRSITRKPVAGLQKMKVTDSDNYHFIAESNGWEIYAKWDGCLELSNNNDEQIHICDRDRFRQAVNATCDEMDRRGDMNKQDFGVTEITYSLKRNGDKWAWVTNSRELYSPEFDSPEQARAWQEERSGGHYVIQSRIK